MKGIKIAVIISTLSLAACGEGHTSSGGYQEPVLIVAPVEVIAPAEAVQVQPEPPAVEIQSAVEIQPPTPPTTTSAIVNIRACQVIGGASCEG
jgi:hypothetical protein